eukprot:g24566.t1
MLPSQRRPYPVNEFKKNTFHLLTGRYNSQPIATFALGQLATIPALDPLATIPTPDALATIPALYALTTIPAPDALSTIPALY